MELVNDTFQLVGQAVEQVFSPVIQMGIDLGIPFDLCPKTVGEIAYFQGCIQWVIFVVTLCQGFITRAITSSMGALR